MTFNSPRTVTVWVRLKTLVPYDLTGQIGRKNVLKSLVGEDMKRLSAKDTYNDYAAISMTETDRDEILDLPEVERSEVLKDKVVASNELYADRIKRAQSKTKQKKKEPEQTGQIYF